MSRREPLTFLATTTGSPTAWGWVLIYVGAVAVLAGRAVMIRRPARRWSGAVVSVVVVAVLMLIPAGTGWALAVITFDVIALATVIVSGRQSAMADRVAGPGRRPYRGGEPAPALRRTRGACAGERGEVERRSPQWLAWRRAAQTVRRAWNEWSAADPFDRDGLYKRYTAAAAAEERAAAELELLVGHPHGAAGPGAQAGQVGRGSRLESAEVDE